MPSQRVSPVQEELVRSQLGSYRRSCERGEFSNRLRSDGVHRRAAAGELRCAALALAQRTLAALLLVLLAMTAPAVAQYETTDDPILAAAISDLEIQIRGRYCRQWRTPEGELALLFNGGFRLDMGKRQMSATNAVVWIATLTDEQSQRNFYALTVYLSEKAEVLEPGGTITEDDVLLVRGVRTFGQIVKHQDAHLAEEASASPLYQVAWRDRQAIEAMDDATTIAGSTRIARPRPPKPPRTIRYRLENIETAEAAPGETVYVSSGGVYFSQDGGPDSAFLEIRAQNAVVFPVAGTGVNLLGNALEGESETGAGAAQPSDDEPPPPPIGPSKAPSEESGAATADSGSALGIGGPGQIRAVYLEGDCVLSYGTRFIRAHRIYYDFERERALILDGVFRAEIPQRGIPLYIRADEIRQLSGREFSAKNARITTSEFFTPHYHVGADKVILRDVTPRDQQGRAQAPVTGEYETTNTTFNVEGFPIAYWPYSKGRLEQTEQVLRSLSTGYSSRYGYVFRSDWSLFNLMGIVPPPGYDATLRLDYLSDRGPAIGVNADYEQKDHFGLLRTYFINDNGRDQLGPLREFDEQPASADRGRVLWRHRHYLPDNWEITLELSYVGDPYFLEEYEKDEWFEGKSQETVVYLKRAKGNEAISLLANWRLLDFVTQTEHLPDFVYRRIGDTLFEPLVTYGEARFGTVRYLPDDRRLYDQRRFNNDGRSDLTVRGDGRGEVELPLKLGAANAVPFASFRGSYWDGQPLAPGALWRGLGVYGVRGSTAFFGVNKDAKSELFDVDGVRHIVRPDFAAWWAHSNERSGDITPFDYGIETIDAFYGMTAGVRQTWQTKRGPAGKQRTVDWITLNLEMGLFGDTKERTDVSNGYANPLRPENSRTRNYLAGDLVYRLSDSTSLLYDFNFDMNDRSYDRHNVSIAVERSPRLAYIFGARYAGDIEMALVGGGWNYKLNEKHITAFRAWFDVDTGQLGEVAFSYVRKLPRWYAGVNASYNQVDDDFSVTFSLWPEGVPEWALGSRRFTNLSTSTGIRP